MLRVLMTTDKVGILEPKVCDHTSSLTDSETSDNT